MQLYPPSSITLSTTLTTIDCCACGITFAVPKVWEQQRRDDHAGFYCPNGHSLTFYGKTEAEKLRERLETAEARAEVLRKEADRQRDRLAREQRSHAATKGQLTKTKKRVAAGVCPCCSRSFVQLARHMAGQHPEYVAEVSS